MASPAPAAGGSSVPQFASLYVGDLHPDVTEAMLYEIFNSVGPVASIRVCRDSVTRRSLGYGYVNFHGVQDAERALDTLNYSSIKGRSCRIMWSQRDPTLRKSGAGNIYVKNLDTNIDNKALYDTFSLFGNILSCKVSADARSGKSHGYGFVHYETEEAAKQAIERVNGMQIGDKTVQVCEFQKTSDAAGGDTSNFKNLYVKNFPSEWDDAKVNEVFGAMGAIFSSLVREDNKGRKFAFVAYEEADSAKKAVDELHGKDMRTEEQKAKEGPAEKDIEGHLIGELYVQRAQTKKERAAELRSKFGAGESQASGGGNVNLYIKNLDESTDSDSLRALFEPYGTVTSAKAMMDVPKDGDEKAPCKGFGFVCFEKPEEATKAVTEMHLKVVKGKPLYVGLAEKKDIRQERLRQRYVPDKGDKGGKGKKGGKGDGGFKGGPQMAGMKGGPQMGGPGMMMGMGGPMGMPAGPMGMPGAMMMGKGAPMMRPGMPMMNPQMMMGKGPMPGMPMGGKGMPMGMPGPMGMMRPGMPMPQMPRPGMPGPMPGQPMPNQTPPGPPNPNAPLSAAALAAAPPATQKQMIGEKLYPAIAKFQPELAGKVTGMMLEMDNSELLLLLESDQQLKNKVDEALKVLQSQK